MVFAACAQQAAPPSRTPADAGHHEVKAPSITADKPVDMPGVHNVVAYAPNLYSGSVPDGTEGLQSLAAMGIKTIVSVDGSTPDVETAKALGMHYIHLPIGYDTVPPERARQLAAVITQGGGPIYMHCHHGKHRSAGALATACVTAGVLSPDAAVARMKVSGTSQDYAGLYASTSDADVLPHAELPNAKTLPSANKVSGMVELMVKLDYAFDDMKAVQGAKWQAPPKNPDLTADKVAKLVHEVFVDVGRDAETAALGAEFSKLLAESTAMAEAVRRAVGNGDPATADAQFKALTASCKTCHKVYRDK